MTWMPQPQVLAVLSRLHQLQVVAGHAHLVMDTRLLRPEDVLVALPGDRFDPRDLADELLSKAQCSVAVVEQDPSRVYRHPNVIEVHDLKACLAELSASFYGHPSRQLTVIAVTGTNGKTTVTRWLAQALNGLGERAAVIGTLGYGLPDALEHHSGLTTPDAVNLQRTLFDLQQRGFKWACLEASSIGLDQGRMDWMQIRLAAYTNFTRDHLDYHSSMQAYEEAKLTLARWPGLGVVVVKSDQSACLRFGAVAQEHGARCVSFGRSSAAHYRLHSTVYTLSGLSTELINVQGQPVRLLAPVVGDFNAENLALVYACLSELGFDDERVKHALGCVTAAPGRMQQVSSQPCVIVDYAHTPDALEKLIKALRPVAEQRGGRLHILFGCGGDRDPGKRPVMGRVAESLADQVWITSDNPRSERPQAIIQDILGGIVTPGASTLHVIEDRALAIRECVTKASLQDVVLLAGKGHETTQLVGDQVLKHSDVECALTALKECGLV